MGLEDQALSRRLVAQAASLRIRRRNVARGLQTAAVALRTTPPGEARRNAATCQYPSPLTSSSAITGSKAKRLSSAAASKAPVALSTNAKSYLTQRSPLSPSWPELLDCVSSDVIGSNVTDGSQATLPNTRAGDFRYFGRKVRCRSKKPTGPTSPAIRRAIPSGRGNAIALASQAIPSAKQTTLVRASRRERECDLRLHPPSIGGASP